MKGWSVIDEKNFRPMALSSNCMGIKWQIRDLSPENDCSRMHFKIPSNYVSKELAKHNSTRISIPAHNATLYFIYPFPLPRCSLQ